MKKPHAYILIGLPGTGKSTYIDTLVKANSDYVVCSSDQFIDAVAVLTKRTYSEVFTDNIDAANLHCIDTFESAVKEKRNIIIDRTNMSRKSRKRWVNQLRTANYHVTAIVFRQPNNIEDLYTRLKQRAGKHIPKHVIETMTKSYCHPTFEEGFDAVRIIDTFN